VYLRASNIFVTHRKRRDKGKKTHNNKCYGPLRQAFHEVSHEGSGLVETCPNEYESINTRTYRHTFYDVLRGAIIAQTQRVYRVKTLLLKMLLFPHTRTHVTADYGDEG